MEDARLEALRADVIEKEQGPRAEHRDVVDAVIHEIGADRFVAIERESDLQFRPDAVYARNQDRLAQAREVRREQAAESADLTEDFRAVRALHPRLNALLDEIAEVHVHPGARVSFFLINRRFHRLRRLALKYICVICEICG